MPATLLKNPYVWAAGVAMVALPPCEMAANIEAELTRYWLD